MSSLPSDASVRWRVVLRLQNLQDCRHPGSERHRIADHAVDLALSDRRTDEDVEHLLRNCLRDSRRVLERRWGKRRELLDPLDGSTDLGEAVLAGAVPGAVLERTPANEHERMRIEERLREQACRAGPHGERCLEGMLLGETIEETAEAAGVSRYKVKQIRRQVRSAARREGACDGTA